MCRWARSPSVAVACSCGAFICLGCDDLLVGRNSTSLLKSFNAGAEGGARQLRDIAVISAVTQGAENTPLGPWGGPWSRRPRTSGSSLPPNRLFFYSKLLEKRMEQFVLVTLVAVGGGVLLGAALAYLFMRSAAAAREAQLHEELTGLQSFREEALSLRAQAARLEQVEAERLRLQEEHAAARLEGQRLSRSEEHTSELQSRG